MEIYNLCFFCSFLDAASAHYRLTLTSYRQPLEWHHRGVLDKVWPRPSQSQNCRVAQNVMTCSIFWQFVLNWTETFFKRSVIPPSFLSDTWLTTLVLQLSILTHLKVKLIFYIILYVCVSQGLGTIKWIWLAEIDIDWNWPLSRFSHLDRHVDQHLDRFQFALKK